MANLNKKAIFTNFLILESQVLAVFVHKDNRLHAVEYLLEAIKDIVSIGINVDKKQCDKPEADKPLVGVMNQRISRRR